MKNHQNTLESKITEYEHLNEALKDNGRKQEAEIISLRSFKAKSELKLQEKDVRLQEAEHIDKSN